MQNKKKVKKVKNSQSVAKSPENSNKIITQKKSISKASSGESKKDSSPHKQEKPSNSGFNLSLVFNAICFACISLVVFNFIFDELIYSFNLINNSIALSIILISFVFTKLGRFCLKTVQNSYLSLISYEWLSFRDSLVFGLSIAFLTALFCFTVLVIKQVFYYAIYKLFVPFVKSFIS